MSEASAVLLLVGVGVWGCGGSGSSGRNFDTGLAEDLALQDVTPAQSQSACENLRSSVQARFSVASNLRHVCELFGALSTTNAADCGTVADSCVQQSENGAADAVVPSEDLDFTANLECDTAVDQFAGCSVTVGEYEDCLNDQFSQVEELFSSFSCAKAGTLTTAEVQGLSTQLESPTTTNAACQRLEAECPAAAPFGASEEEVP
jgi:hypothetical protein